MWQWCQGLAPSTARPDKRDRAITCSPRTEPDEAPSSVHTPMSDLRRCMQASNSDSDSDTSSSDDGQSARKRRKEKREHTHKRKGDKARIHKRHKEKKLHKRHKERHHSDKTTSPRHKERHHTDKVASSKHKERHHGIDKEAKSPRSVMMVDTKSGIFCPQKSRVAHESEAVAERRLAAAKHCAEQRETASTYQAVVIVAPPVPIV